MKTIALILLFVLCAIGRTQAADEASSGVQLFPGDKLSFSIDEDPKQGTGPTDVLVSPLGDLRVAVSRCCDLSITVNVKEKTLPEVQDEIRKRLESDYYKKATVHLSLTDKSTRMGKVFFSGAVKQTVLNLSTGDKKKLYDALLEVGLSEYANIKKVKLQRTDPATRQQVSKVYDMKLVKDGKKGAEDPLLQDGDRIEVPEKGISF